MNRHDTPNEIACVLARHAPRGVRSILDPAVGKGALLGPVLSRLDRLPERIVCVDSDSRVLRYVGARFGASLGSCLRLIHADFLEWSLQAGQDEEGCPFDCIVMNPPFLGRRKSWIGLNLGGEFPRNGSGSRFVPLEAAFVARAITLLRPYGRLLAVVPASVVASLTTRWLRELMLQMGTFRYIHELPSYTFSGVEARIYLLVYDKGRKKRSVMLCNHELVRPERMAVRAAELHPDFRLDYGFHQAIKWYGSVKGSSRDLGWARLGDIVSIYRGMIESPGAREGVVHTVDYKDGFWKAPGGGDALRRNNVERGIRKGDLLIKRVGRGCAQSIGKLVGRGGWAFSDCVLILRPRRAVKSTQLLFALRVLLAWDQGARLLERVTGASYITARELAALSAPLGLANRHRQAYELYRRAVARRRVDIMGEIEERVRRCLSPRRG